MPGNGRRHLRGVPLAGSLPLVAVFDAPAARGTPPADVANLSVTLSGAVVPGNPTLGSGPLLRISDGKEKVPC